MAIRTWASDATQAIFQGKNPDLVPRSVLARAHRKLVMLHAAADLRDLRVPRATGWRSCAAHAKDSTASVLMISTASVLRGVVAMRIKWKSSIIIVDEVK